MMATQKAFLEYILDQLSGLDGISARSMMGEYLIYYHGKIAAYLCDGRLFVKPVPSALARMPEAVYQAPYPGAKEMLLVENVDDRDFLMDLFSAMYEELPAPKPRRERPTAKKVKE